MKIIDNIRFKIDRLPKGYVFTYTDLGGEVEKKEAIIKSLNRLAALGKINKLSQGKYYKPETSAFGNLQPAQYQIVKDLLEKKGKPIGYITGYGAYNELGLTTQVSNTIQIGRNEVRPALRRGLYKIAFIKQKNKITSNNIPLLKILDAIRFIKAIPDASIEESCTRLIAIIRKLTPKEIEMIIKLSMNYPPATRALLGTLVEITKGVNIAKAIKKTLNPITNYKLAVSEKILPNAKNWNIQ